MIFGMSLSHSDSKKTRKKPSPEKGRVTKDDTLDNVNSNLLKPSDLGAGDEWNLKWIVEEGDEY